MSFIASDSLNLEFANLLLYRCSCFVLKVASFLTMSDSDDCLHVEWPEAARDTASSRSRSSSSRRREDRVPERAAPEDQEQGVLAAPPP